ncbi:Trafficking kinesin-binding protein [Ooceraea biroi]|uniref:Trafficking kinesin-binding protein n=1 Tax=Ooceraea biroi TaxID=2015173 RepID=A0A026VYF6_OOCBI|nr:Trafficking kinesin-binding protein [Ooceraea biroi]
MLLRGIAFAEARRNSARRVFKSCDKTNGCEKDVVASDLSHDGSLVRHTRTAMICRPPEEPLSPVFSIPFESEAISLVATASKLATVEDVGPKRPEGPIRPSTTSLKVSPTARATLQALRSSPKSKLATPVSTRDAETITGSAIAGHCRQIMYLGTREAGRPKGPARLKGILERRETVLSKWRDEVCSGEELPEVEIISLLEEQIPRYRLRADTLTQFQGYENADWFIPAPALKLEDADLKLSPDQIRETLNYFRKCNFPTFLLFARL